MPDDLVSHVPALVVWLGVQVNDDEWAASKTIERTWRQSPVNPQHVSTVRVDGSSETVAQCHYMHHAAHIARHDPSRALRETQVKRKILNLWNAADSRRHESAEDEARAWLMDAVVEALAPLYANRPGFREEWRP